MPEPRIDPDILRAPPTNPEAEAALLGILLSFPGSFDRVADLVGPEDFADQLHTRIFAAIAGQAQQHKPHDIVTLAGLFSATAPDLDDPDDLSEREYLVEISHSVITAGPAADYARLIADLADRRRRIAVHLDALQRYHEPSIDLIAGDISANVLRDLEVLPSGRAASEDIISAADGIAAALAASEHAASHGGLVGLSSGFDRIDDHIHGLVPGQLTIIGGRPSMGKSLIGLGMGLFNARAGYSVFAVSLEMQRASLWQRFLAAETGIDLDRIIKGVDLSSRDWDRLTEAQAAMQGLPLWLADRRGMTVDRIHALARAQKRTHGLDLLIVDHLQIVAAADDGRWSRGKTEDLTHISGALARIAGDLDVPVVALAQLSRAVEARDDKRPMLSDLRESGSIEQDADVVMLLYRQDYYLERSRPQKSERETAEKYSARLMAWQDHLDQVRGEAEVIVAKSRHGRIGTVRLGFDGAHARFCDLNDAALVGERTRELDFAQAGAL